MNKYQMHLFEIRADESFRDLQLRTIPGIKPDDLIGIRTPDLRGYAKELVRSGEAEHFIAKLPHRYFDEYLLHGLILSQFKDYDKLTGEIDRFLPFVDNWAVCDQTNPKIFAKYKDELLLKIRSWIVSDHDYTVRFAIRMLMNHFLGDGFRKSYADMVVNADNGNYYVSMMCAWYFATALASNYDEIVPYIEERRLAKWTHNKTIQKAVESYRISDTQKQYLKALKQKV